MSKKTKTYDIPEEVAATIAAERKSLYGIKSYVSLFSSADIVVMVLTYYENS